MNEMNVANFAEEFTQFLLRWTVPNKENEKQNTVATTDILTSQQVVSTVQDVLSAVLGVKLQSLDYSSVKTPAATAMAICTPSAPTVTKILSDSGNISLSRYRSLDTLSANMSETTNFKLSGSMTFAGNNENNTELMDTDTTEAQNEEKKLISRSSPAIYVSTVRRSSTFIQDEESKESKENNKDLEDKFESAAKIDFDSAESEKGANRALFHKLEQLRKSALEVVLKIDDVKKVAYPQSTKPIRRLSTIGGLSSLSRASSMLRPVPPPKLRRYSTGFPGTPTSSKLNSTLTVEKDETSSKRRTVSGAMITTSKLGVTTTPSNRSSPYKISPGSTGRPAKNPKYAHVQSTIPKVTVGKRKAT